MWPALALLLTLAQEAPTLPFPVPFKLDAWLECPGGKIEFVIDVPAPRGKAGTHSFVVLNGSRGQDQIWIERWSRTPDSLGLHIDSYESHLKFLDAKVAGELRGTWRRLSGPDQWVEMPLGARLAAPVVPAPAGGATAPPQGSSTPPAPINGRWSVKFSATEDPSVGVFAHPSPDKIEGTFLTTLGDYRYLSGRFDPEQQHWKLSCFDGVHAFLFTARALPDGTLAGDFWSGDKWHETWTGKRNSSAALPDPFGLTKAEAKVDFANLIFTGVHGNKISLADPMFASQARIVVLFGTWCPNCNDEAAHLRDLDQQYGHKGLSIVGLAFEHTSDQAKGLEQLKRFAARHKLRFPLLLAGKSDKAEASKAFPLLDKVRAFPTTIFLRPDGTVHAVHQGYSGPATSADHQKLRADFDRVIRELLPPKPPTSH